MPDLQDAFDEAMLDFTHGDFDAAIARFRAILARDPVNFDAQLALGMAYFRKGDHATAIAEGHKAEKLRPQEPLVHTNLSLFYLKNGNKQAAEHHGMQARIASWRTAPPQGPAGDAAGAGLEAAPPAAPKPPVQFPAMPWKKKTPEP